MKNSTSWLGFQGKALRFLFTIAMVAFWTACADDSQNIGPDNDAASAKTVNGGNETCTVGAFSTGRINYDVATGDWYSTGKSAANGDAPFDFGDHGFKIIVSADGKSFSWSADPGICVRQVIIKGADAAFVKTYDGTQTSDSGLAAPVKGKNIPQISNATICYDICPKDKCYKFDTAFGGDTDKSAGVPSWWFAFDANGSSTQTIFAGQTKVAGTVSLVDGSFTISLVDGFELSGVDQSVKIGGYNTLPTNRPSAGNYEKSGGVTLYKGKLLTVPVASYPYYVVHLDVKQVVECPL